MGLVIGDNLAVNAFLEFVKSFNATYYCRLCRTPKQINQQMTLDEANTVYRNINNYMRDLEMNDSTQTGIKGNSIFNSIPSFHVTENPYADIMHDLFEGVLHYDYCHVLSNFISRGVITLEQFNLRKQLFNYGPIEIENISEEIKIEHIRSGKLRMSAREMMTFCHYFTLFIGDLVNNDDETWKFVCLIFELVELLLSHSFTTESVNYLSILIQEHNSKYIELFSDTLKPKHHFMSHYPYIIRKSGPLQQLNCFLYELRNRDGKTYAHSMNSRVNTPISLAKKSQLQFAYNLMCYNTDLIESDNKFYSHIDSYYMFIFEQTGLEREDFTLYYKLLYCGKVYKKGYYLSCFGEIPKLCKILQLIVHNEHHNRKLKIICSSIILHHFNFHYQAYEITSDFNDSILEIYDIEYFSGPPINICLTFNGQRFVKLKDYY